MKTRTNERLFHYTCAHAVPKIQAAGVILSPQLLHVDRPLDGMAQWLANVAWATDLDQPFAEALGLTANSLYCDRTEYRVVLSPDNTATWWPTYRRAHDLHRLPFVKLLEEADGARPVHWWVSADPIPVLRIEKVRNVSRETEAS